MNQTSLARCADIPRCLIGLAALAVVAPVVWVVATVRGRTQLRNNPRSRP